MSRYNIKFKKSYLQYYKIILAKVSFCNKLFRREYNKAVKLISPSEVIILDNWIRSKKLKFDFNQLLIK